MDLDKIEELIIPKIMETLFVSEFVNIEDCIVNTELEMIETRNVIASQKEGSESGRITLGEFAKHSLFKNHLVNKLTSKNYLEKIVMKAHQECYPHVAKIDKYYYITDDGNHRLVLSKLLGIDRAYAVVQILTPEKESEILKKIKPPTK